MASCSNKESSSAGHPGEIGDGGAPCSWHVPHNIGHISGTEKMPKAPGGKSQNAAMSGLAHSTGSSLPLQVGVDVVVVAVFVVLVVDVLVVGFSGSFAKHNHKKKKKKSPTKPLIERNPIFLPVLSADWPIQTVCLFDYTVFCACSVLLCFSSPVRLIPTPDPLSILSSAHSTNPAPFFSLVALPHTPAGT